MQKAAKRKMFLFLSLVVSALLSLSPTSASGASSSALNPAPDNHVLASKTRAELFLLGGQNRVEKSTFESVKHVEIEQRLRGIALGSPLAPKGVVPKNLIDDALNSTATATKLEGKVGNHLFDRLTNFQRQFADGSGRIIGEIDVEVPEAIIEATVGKGGKVQQVTKLVNNRILNPNGKPVIVFGPNLKRHAIQSIEDAGGYVARTLDELDELLKRLGQ